MRTRTVLASAAIATVAGTASAQWFTTSDFPNWAAAVDGPVEILDITSGGPFLADIGQGPLGAEIVPGLTVFADGPGLNQTASGFTVEFGIEPSQHTTFVLEFDTPITALAWDHFNFPESGVTVSTGLNSYDIETLEGGGTPANTIGSIGLIEPAGATTITFTRTDPGLDPFETWFLDAPLQVVFIPSPSAAGLLAIAGVAAVRRRR